VKEKRLCGDDVCICSTETYPNATVTTYITLVNEEDYEGDWSDYRNKKAEMTLIQLHKGHTSRYFMVSRRDWQEWYFLVRNLGYKHDQTIALMFTQDRDVLSPIRKFWGDKIYYIAISSDLYERYMKNQEGEHHSRTGLRLRPQNPIYDETQRIVGMKGLLKYNFDPDDFHYPVIGARENLYDIFGELIYRPYWLHVNSFYSYSLPKLWQFAKQHPEKVQAIQLAYMSKSIYTGHLTFSADILYDDPKLFFEMLGRHGKWWDVVEEAAKDVFGPFTIQHSWDFDNRIRTRTLNVVKKMVRSKRVDCIPYSQKGSVVD